MGPAGRLANRSHGDPMGSPWGPIPPFVEGISLFVWEVFPSFVEGISRLRGEYFPPSEGMS